MGGFLKNTAILLGVLVCLPYLVELATRKPFAVHTSGAVILTGASTGIGRHAAEALAREGYIVYAGVRKEDDVQSLNSGNIATLRPVILEVTDQSHIDALYERIQADGAKLIAVINNAGVSGSNPVELLDMNTYDSAFNINVRGPVLMMQKFLPLLRLNKGRIINVTSMVTYLRFGGCGAYCPSKIALESFTDQLRREIAIEGHDVAVSIIQPATIASAIWQKAKATREATDNTQLMKLYPGVVNWGKKFIQGSVANADGPEVSTAAIREALTSPYPKTRYQCARISGGLHASVATWITWLVPDRILDLMLSANP